MKRLLRPISWLTWKAADLTAWIFESVPDAERFEKVQDITYGLYNVTCRFAFWFDERFELGQSEVVS